MKKQLEYLVKLLLIIIRIFALFFITVKDMI